MIRLYTKSYDIGLLKQTGSSLFTGEEYARVTEVEFAKILESKESAIRYDIPEKIEGVMFSNMPYYEQRIQECSFAWCWSLHA